MLEKHKETIKLMYQISVVVSFLLIFVLSIILVILFIINDNSTYLLDAIQTLSILFILIVFLTHIAHTKVRK